MQSPHVLALSAFKEAAYKFEISTDGEAMMVHNRYRIFFKPTNILNIIKHSNIQNGFGLVLIATCMEWLYEKTSMSGSK